MAYVAKKLTDTLAVSPQPELQDFEAIAKDGFVRVINNRPDGEAADQPDHLAAEQAARAAGLEYHYLPVTGPGITEDDIAAFARLISDAQGPVLAHCASGGRSALLWALAATEVPTADAIARAGAVGIDLSSQAGRIGGRR